MNVDPKDIGFDKPMPNLPALQNVRSTKYLWLTKALDKAKRRIEVPVTFESKVGTPGRRREYQRIHSVVQREAKRRGVKLSCKFYGEKGGTSAVMVIEMVPPTDTELDGSGPVETPERPEVEHDLEAAEELGVEPEATDSETAAYNQGYEARDLHRPSSANPYNSGTAEAVAWFSGWKAHEEAAALVGNDEEE